ncbi:hypothetical protein [Leptolyngbya sp. NIES-2104]|uniref:hypothetical protein n=1 Tax=Leptolyngbya sp. NIES-2104 TaxID=1552121 RepID=UPI0006EC985A|nr:hypothetical protein [Leptolyngbya sp. NIES-2104]GAP97194.1 chromosome segregation ATPase [Leptolyngbya sp. NIES-2104]
MNRLEKKCLMGLLALPVGISTIAFIALRNPYSIECAQVEDSSPVSTRLHCAQQRANRDTPESLAAAIEMLQNVAIDDPYHQQSTQLIQRWSNALLMKAETEVQAGNLDKGIEIVRSLPQDAKVRSWKLLWEKGETLMKTALTQVEKREWHQAFETAKQLQKLENQYWATEQYNSLIDQIQNDREFRDWKLKNSVEPRKTPKQIELNLPKPEKVARQPRSLWKPQEDRARPVTAVESPKPEIQPTPEIQPPQIQPSSDPEPPVEVLPQEQPSAEAPIPAPEQVDDSAPLRDRTQPTRLCNCA